MLQKLNFIYLFLALFPFNISGSVIKGYEPDYAGRNINFYVYADPITKTEKSIFSILINNNGQFSRQVEVKETTVCYADFDVYSTMLILEPTKTVKIKLPPLREKTFSEQKNPYFKPMKLWIMVDSKDESEINKVCSGFEKQFNALTDKYFNQLYFRQSKPILDTVTNQLRNDFQTFSNPFVRNLINFKLKILEGEVMRQNQDKLLAELKPATFSYFNPGLIDLIDRIYSNKLVFETNSIRGSVLRDSINNGNLSTLKEFVRGKYGLQPGVDEFLILKLLHDAFYSGNFSKQAILAMLRQDTFTKNNDLEIRDFANSIITKLVYLEPGTRAPEICLSGLNNEVICTGESQAFKYLIFVDMEIQICREHLKYLPVITSKYKDNLDVFIIIVNKNSEKINDFIESNNISGKILFDNETDNYSKKYRVRSFPSCILLSKNHDVILTSAKSPLDGFENQFGSFLKKEYLNQQRNQR